MTLAAVFTVFNRLELLRGAMEAIKPEVDMFLIVYQNCGWDGTEERNVLLELKQVLEGWKGKPIYFSEYVPRPKRNAKVQEINKHIQGVRLAAKKEATHFILMATDHYFVKEEFKKAKEKIKKEKIDSSACQMYTYILDNETILEPIESYYAPFICEIKPNTSFSHAVPVYIDPSCGAVPYDNFYAFKNDELMMHHFSWVGNDLESKIKHAPLFDNSVRGKLKVDKEVILNVYYKNHNLCKIKPQFLLDFGTRN
jgi:hypothetical protein